MNETDMKTEFMVLFVMGISSILVVYLFSK